MSTLNDEENLFVKDSSSSDDDFIILCCPEQSNQTNKTESNRPNPLKLLFRICIFIVSVVTIYFVFTVLRTSQSKAVVEPVHWANTTKAISIINELCTWVSAGRYSGDLCDILCLQNWTVLDMHEGAYKNVIKLRVDGKDFVIKMLHAFPWEYREIGDNDTIAKLVNKTLDRVNDHTYLGWPARYQTHLMKRLLPSYRPDQQLSKAEKQTLAALLQQNEYINSKILTLSRVTPKIKGICGHAYMPEYLIPFKMKPYYMSLRAKILVHLEGTLKLFDEFLNEPLQWCDVKFENLGLSSDYPKRFVVMDSHMLFTESKLNSLLTSKTCVDDSQCGLLDCKSVCLKDTGYCSKRVNDNIEVFCKNLIGHIFSNFWSRANKFLAACNPEDSSNITKRIDELRLAWSYTISDI